MIVSKQSVLLSIFLTVNVWGDSILLSDKESLTQEEAIDYCHKLGKNWYLPSIKTLYELSKTTKLNLDYSYWSSSWALSGDAEIGTGSEGDGGILAKVGYSFYPKEKNVTLSPQSKRIAALCTNIDIKHYKNHYIDHQNLVYDEHNKIYWHHLLKTDRKKKFTYKNAQNYCDSLSIGGRIWRLPSVDELYSIVDYDYSLPSVDTKYFDAVMHRYYWTQSSLNEQENYVVGFKLGSIATVQKSEEAFVRCVSDE